MRLVFQMQFGWLPPFTQMTLNSCAKTDARNLGENDWFFYTLEFSLLMETKWVYCVFYKF